MKKEYPIDGIEEDVCSKYARRLYCYLRNNKGVTKYVKRKMHKRFRSKERKLILNELYENTL